MHNDYDPVIFFTPNCMSAIEVYLIHDLHMGNVDFDNIAWEKTKAEILAQPNRYVVFIGDMMENAIPGSKSDIFTQTATPLQQREWLAKQFIDLKDRIIAITDGNHERNRSFRSAGLFPAYDAAVIAGVDAQYRPHFAVCDIGVGARDKDKSQQVHYVLYCVHRAKEGKGANTALATGGIDAVCCGHTHSPADVPRAQICYNPHNKVVFVKNVEFVNSGSWVNYGHYAADGGYLPNSDKKYKLILHSGAKKIETVGFHT